MPLKNFWYYYNEEDEGKAIKYDWYTVSGAIASFNTEVSAPLRNLTADISYTQDLHGYANPWLPGGGKNLLNYDVWKTVTISHGDAVWENNGVTLTATDNDCYTQYNNTYYPSGARIPITQGETITVSWEETENASGIVYIFPNGNTSGLASINNNRAKQLSYTAGPDVTYVTLRFGVTTSGVTIAYKNIQVVKGTTIPAWSPYENICPISGFTGVNVTRTGKNLFDGTFIADTMIVDSTGEYYANAYHKCSNKILAKENTVYTLSGTDLHKRSGTATNAANVTIAYYKVDGTYIRREAPDTSTNTYKTVTTPANTAFVIFQVGGQATNVMLEESATETTYEPYTGSTYSITFPAVGKNLFDKNAITPNSWIVVNTTTIEPQQAYFVSDYIPVEVGKPIFCTTRGASRSIYYDKNKNPISYFSWNTGALNPLYDGYIRVTDINTNLDTLQIELGSTATAYEPYTTTVYGGTLDVVSGLLTVDRAGVDLGTLTWEVRYTETNNKTIRTNLPLTLPHAQTRKIISENYKYQGTVTTASILQHPDSLDIGLRTYYKEDRLGYDDIVYAVIPVSESPDGLLVYELAEPVTYQLTPTEVTALLGDNTIWADTGDVTVTYKDKAGKTITAVPRVASVSPTAFIPTLQISEINSNVSDADDAESSSGESAQSEEESENFADEIMNGEEIADNGNEPVSEELLDEDVEVTKDVAETDSEVGTETLIEENTEKIVEETAVEETTQETAEEVTEETTIEETPVEANEPTKNLEVTGR